MARLEQLNLKPGAVQKALRGNGCRAAIANITATVAGRAQSMADYDAEYASNVQRGRKGYYRGLVYTANYAAIQDNDLWHTLRKAAGR